MTKLLPIVRLEDGRWSKNAEDLNELKCNSIVCTLCQCTQLTKLNAVVLVVQHIVVRTIGHGLVVNKINLCSDIHSSC